MIWASRKKPVSLEQLMLLASQLAQAPRPPAVASRRPQPPRFCASAQLTAEELEALDQIWTTPLRSQLATAASPVSH